MASDFGRRSSRSRSRLVSSLGSLTSTSMPRTTTQRWKWQGDTVLGLTTTTTDGGLFAPHRREFASELSAARVQALCGLVIGTTSRDFSSSRFSGSGTTLPLGSRWRARPLPFVEISSSHVLLDGQCTLHGPWVGLYMLPALWHRTPHAPLVGLHMWSALTVRL